MQHHYDVGAQSQRFLITRFLIAPVTSVLRMNEGAEPEAFRFDDRIVVARIVGYDDLVHQIHRDLSDGSLECLGCVVRRHHNDDFFVVEHACFGLLCGELGSAAKYSSLRAGNGPGEAKEGRRL